MIQIKWILFRFREFHIFKKLRCLNIENHDFFKLASRRNDYEYRFVRSDQTVTMRNVALAAGVAVSTVSKALRNDPTIPPKRCLELQRLAEDLGYRPHPLVATLMAQLHHRRRRNDPLSIAWIDLWSAATGQESAINLVPVLTGAQERANELGYRIEVYRAGREQITPEQLNRLLTAKGQWGLIIPPVPESFKYYPLDLRGLSAVTIGTSLQNPVMHRVSPNHFQGCVLAFKQLQKQGRKRIGLALSPTMNERTEGKWLGAYLSSQACLRSKEKVKPLIANPDDLKKISAWLDNDYPDVVLVAEKFQWKRASTLNQTPHQVPDLAWLMLSEPKNPKELCGLDYRPQQLGRAALEMVVAQIHRNERGHPDIAQTVLIDAIWSE